MSERSYITNGRFFYDLQQWSASSAVFSSGDGDDHYGVAVLSTGGGYIEQDFSVPNARSYAVHLDVKAVGAPLSAGQGVLTILDSFGNTVLSQNLSGTADTWTANDFTFGLAPGNTYTFRITNVSAAGSLKVDDVWLWFVPKTRAQLAAIVHAKLARLATERSLSTTPSGSSTEGDYTSAVDAGLRTVGAINPETDLPDTRYLSVEMVDTALEAIELEMLERLQRDYAVEVDITVGPRTEKLSQIAAAIGKLGGSGGSGSGSARPVTRRMTHRADGHEWS